MAYFQKSVYLVLIAHDSIHFSPLYAFTKMKDAQKEMERCQRQYPDAVTKIDYLPLFD